jgi:hypothetical protein
VQSTLSPSDSPKFWHRKAAELGPGYRGRRAVRTPQHVETVFKALTSLGQTPPPYLSLETGWIDRPAKLFEAGAFPDKGVTVTSEDLAAIADNFDLPVPVWIEHAETPLDLGYLIAVEARDDELFGTLALTAEADALLARSGARSLSVGLSPDLRQIQEVSLVKHPRVASAQIFATALTFEGSLQPDAFDKRRRQIEEEEERLDTLQIERTLDGLIRQGRLMPAQRAYAKALLGHKSPLLFDGDTLPVSELTLRLLESNARHGLFREHVPVADAEAADKLLLPEEADFYRKYFPDIDLSVIADKKH